MQSTVRLSLSGFGPIVTWIQKESYGMPGDAAVWQQRLRSNYSNFRLSYLSVWALITWAVNAPNVYGSVAWVSAFLACFIVQHPWLTQPKKITACCLGILSLVATSACVTSSCLSWSQLISVLVVVIHASLLKDGPGTSRLFSTNSAGSLTSSESSSSRSTPSAGNQATAGSSSRPTKPLPPVPSSAGRGNASKPQLQRTPTPSPAATSPTPAPALSQENEKRTKIVQEIMSTEATYLSTLQLVRDQFLVPFRQEAERGKDSLLSLDDVRTIFSDIEVILNYSQTLLEELRSRLTHWENDSSKLGDIFLRIAHFLKTYQPYVVNYGASMATLQRCCKDTAFAAMLKRLESDPRCKNGSLQSFLITPIQRIPRYLLLLKELIKNTAAQHPDSADLAKSLEQIQQVATTLNEAERAAESSYKLFTFQMAIGSDDGIELLAAHRRYITEGLLKGNLKTDDVDADLVELYVLLCNDCMLICKTPTRRMSAKLAPTRSDSPTKASSFAEIPAKLSVKRLIKLHEVTLTSTQGNKFTLNSADQKAIFDAPNVTEKKDWLHKLQSAIAESSQTAARLGW